MRKLLAANWKENPSSEGKAVQLLDLIARVRRENIEVAIYPPFIYAEAVAARFKKLGSQSRKKLSIGAQDVFWEEKGAYTSEVGPKMLKSLGLQSVIVGHSERRRYLKETDAMINAKIKLAMSDGLRIILCVGEAFTIRRKGISHAKAFIKKQLNGGLKNLKASVLRSGGLAVAYEPIWAIGTGKNDNPEDAREVAAFIKNLLRKKYPDIRVLYGGSVNSSNILDYVQYKEIDGALVGGASLKAAEFARMIKAVDHIK